MSDSLAAAVAAASCCERSFRPFTDDLAFFARVGTASAPCGEKNQSLGLSTGGGEEASVWREDAEFRERQSLGKNLNEPGVTKFPAEISFVTVFLVL